MTGDADAPAGNGREQVDATLLGVLRREELDLFSVGGAPYVTLPDHFDGRPEETHPVRSDRVRAYVTLRICTEVWKLARREEVERLLRLMEGLAYERPLALPEDAVDLSPFLEILLLFLKRSGVTYDGNGADLREKLLDVEKELGWGRHDVVPTTSHYTSHEVRKLIPALKEFGVLFDDKRHGSGAKRLRLTLVPPAPESWWADAPDAAGGEASAAASDVSPLDAAISPPSDAADAAGGFRPVRPRPR